MNKELEAINAEIARLEREKRQLENLRQAKEKLFVMKFKRIPSKFAAEHPILAKIGEGILNSYKAPQGAIKAMEKFANEEHPLLEKIGNHIQRVQSNAAFAKGLRPGEEGFNPQTQQYVRKSDTGDSFTARSKQKMKA